MFKFLTRFSVNLADHLITYQRIAPPLLVAPPAAMTARQQLSTSAARSGDSPRSTKKWRSLFLSATVYAPRSTELRWWDGPRESRAWSNVDFNDLAATTEIETDDAVWVVFMAVDNATERSPAPKSDLERLGKLNDLRPRYVLATEQRAFADKSEAAVPDDSTLAAIDALHAFYAANHTRLAEERTLREAERASTENALREHPRVREDTTINYWPEKSRVYSTTRP